MRNVMTSLVCLAMLTGAQAYGQKTDKAQGQQTQADNKTDNQKQSRNKRQQQRKNQETIRGTVAGVTSIGEAVIDPLTNTAVVAEAE